MSVTSGRPDVVIGVIDGPVDLNHPAFAGASVRTVKPGQSVQCADNGSNACAHGTAVAGVLFARRGFDAPAICPDCTALLYPIFNEPTQGSQEMPLTTPRELAEAILETIDAGANIINLSLGATDSEITQYQDLNDVAEVACRRGVLLVVAAGNQGRVGSLPTIRHPWAIPVVACDEFGRITPESNIGRFIGARGLAAPGSGVLTTSSGSTYSLASGTSIAAAWVTGAVALLKSHFRDADAGQIRRSLSQARREARRSMIPPLLDMQVAMEFLKTTKYKEAIMTEENRLAESGGVALGLPPADLSAPNIGPSTVRRNITGQLDSGSCPTCAAGSNDGPPRYVYATGTVDIRFPSLGVEKEFQQIVATGATASLTDKSLVHKVLKENRYLANEVCWVFTIENVDTYILVPRDKEIMDQFIEAAKPGQRGLDIDVVIGTLGPMAPPQMCNGLQVPIVLVDQTYSFDRPALLKEIKKPKDTKMTDEAFRADADELFNRIQDLADNVGATDEHRAVNYLAVRYQDIYVKAAEMHGRDFSLTGVDIISSRLSGARKLVDVVFSFTHRVTQLPEKYYVRVDVTEKYPFLDKRLAPYYDRQ